MPGSKRHPHSQKQSAVSAAEPAPALHNKKRKVGVGASNESIVPALEPPSSPSDNNDSEPGEEGRLLLGHAESHESWSSIGVAPWLVAQCTSMGLQVRSASVTCNLP